MSLPERRKTPEEIEKLREQNMSAHELPRMRASMGMEEIHAEPEVGTAEPHVVARAQAIAAEFRHLLDPSQPAPQPAESVVVTSVESEVPVAQDAVSEEISLEKSPEIATKDESIVLLSSVADHAATFRKDEESLSADAFLVENADLPEQRRSAEEIEEMRAVQSFEIRETTKTGEVRVKIASRFARLKASVWLLMLCYLTLALGPVAILVGFLLGWRRPISRHHAAILVILGTIVSLFGSLRAYDRVPAFRSAIDRAQERIQKIINS